MRCNYDNYKLTRRCLAIFFLTSDSFIFLSEALIIEDWWSITHVIQSIAYQLLSFAKLAIFNIRQAHDTFFDILVSRIYVFRYWEKPLRKKKIFPIFTLRATMYFWSNIDYRYIHSRNTCTRLTIINTRYFYSALPVTFMRGNPFSTLHHIIHCITRGANIKTWRCTFYVLSRDTFSRLLAKFAYARSPFDDRQTRITRQSIVVTRRRLPSRRLRHAQTCEGFTRR